MELIELYNNIIIVNQITALAGIMLVLQHLLKFQDTALAALGFDITWMIQRVYFILGLLTFGILHPELSPDYGTQMPDKLVAEYRRMCLVAGFRDCLYLVGLVYTIFWCLLQQVLQQPMNTMPLSLLLVQILATLCYSSYSNMQSKKWVEVAALYYLGMSGHFSIGNTNTLATIDVAGAFIGISSHSMVLLGMSMSMITYASPMLALLSMVISLWGNDMSGHANLTGADIGQLMKTTISFPCLVPLGLNSVLLISYTILLLLMRNHLFIWSVFSPKYVYVCTATACVYIGVSVISFTGFYGVLVFALRSRKLHASKKD